MPENNKKENNLVTITICQYYDYSVFSKDEKGNIKEYMLSNMKQNWCILPDDCSNLEKSISYIKNIASKECLADVVLATIYSFSISEKAYEDSKIIFANMSDEQRTMNMFKALLFEKGAVLIKGSYPILLRDISKRDSFYVS